MSDTMKHPCEKFCQYAKDVAMPEHSCDGVCQYDTAAYWKAKTCLLENENATMKQTILQMQEVMAKMAKRLGWHQ